MKKLRLTYVLTLALIAGILSLTCSNDRNVEASSGATDVQMSISNSSLAGAVTTVTLAVVIADELVFEDAAVISEGTFSFGVITLPVGEASFVAEGLSGSGQVLYRGSSTATITSDANADTNVDLLLLPAVPMARMSPYHATLSVGQVLTSTLEIHELQRFYNGSFRFSYNQNLLRFESVLGSYANQWGGLIHFAREDDGELIISLSRTGENDLVPGGVSSLIDLRFTALSSGTAKLAVEVDSLEDRLGRVAEYNSIFIDTQTVTIR